MAGQHGQGIGAAGAIRTSDVLTQYPQFQAAEKCGGEMWSGCSGGCSPGIFPASYLTVALRHQAPAESVLVVLGDLSCY